MAAIQNARDVLLQAAPVRLVMVPIDPTLIPGLPETIGAVRGVKLTAPSNVFQIAAGGAASPASITITATLTLVAAATVWDVVAGTAVLTGTGNSRTVTATTMTSNSVTVRVRVQEVGGPVYTGYWTIAKTADGANGANGANGAPGERGSLTAFGTLSNLVAYPARASGRARWAAGSASEPNAVTADTAARNVIWQRLGNSGSAPSNAHLRLGDTVTLTNTGQTVSATGYWTGAAWDTPGTVIDGNLLVGGNVSGQEFTGGVFTGGAFRTAASGRRLQMEASGGDAHALVFYNGGGGAGFNLRLTSDGQAYAITSDTGYAMRAENFVGGGVQGYTLGSGAGVWGESGNGVGVAGRATGASGVGGVFESVQGAAIRLNPRAAVPVQRNAGSFCVVDGKPCFADGTHWWELTLGTRLT